MPSMKLPFRFIYKTKQLQMRKYCFSNMLPFVEKLRPIKIDPVDQPGTLRIACRCIEAGEVIALPTDTVYGLACNANNEKAIQKLYAIKGRDFHKPVAICVNDIAALRRYGKAEHLNDALLERLLPGPITIVIERSHNLKNRFLNPSTNKIGIRIPNFEFIQQLCALCAEHPLALTSANRSAEPSSLNVQEFSGLWPQLGGIFDGGQLGLNEECRSASTVIDLTQAGKFKIVRAGCALKQTLEIMSEFGISNVELLDS